MAPSKKIELRLDDAARQRWEAAAADVGDSLSSFIRDCVEDRITNDLNEATVAPRRRTRKVQQSADVPPQSKAGADMANAVQDAMSKAAGGGRKQVCPHRRKPDEFCSRCDA